MNTLQVLQVTTQLTPGVQGAATAILCCLPMI